MGSCTHVEKWRGSDGRHRPLSLGAMPKPCSGAGMRMLFADAGCRGPMACRRGGVSPRMACPRLELGHGTRHGTRPRSLGAMHKPCSGAGMPMLFADAGCRGPMACRRGGVFPRMACPRLELGHGTRLGTRPRMVGAMPKPRSGAGMRMLFADAGCRGPMACRRGGVFPRMACPRLELGHGTRRKTLTIRDGQATIEPGGEE